MTNVTIVANNWHLQRQLENDVTFLEEQQGVVGPKRPTPLKSAETKLVSNSFETPIEIADLMAHFFHTGRATVFVEAGNVKLTRCLDTEWKRILEVKRGIPPLAYANANPF